MPIDEDEYRAAGVLPASAGPVDQLAPDVPHPLLEGAAASAAGASLGFDVEMQDADPTLAALQAMGRALEDLAKAKQLAPEPMVLAKHRFRIVCMEVFGHLYSEDDATALADTLIGGVYSGHLGYKQLRAYVDRRQKLTAEQRALALGLCAGFMVDFLPRVRG